jgi:hypothetical protein
MNLLTLAIILVLTLLFVGLDLWLVNSVIPLDWKVRLWHNALLSTCVFSFILKAFLTVD